jgi:hypothetical protein
MYNLTNREERWLELTANGAKREDVLVAMEMGDAERLHIMARCRQKLGATSLPHTIAIAVAERVVSVYKENVRG